MRGRKRVRAPVGVPGSGSNLYRMALVPTESATTERRGGAGGC